MKCLTTNFNEFVEAGGDHVDKVVTFWCEGRGCESFHRRATFSPGNSPLAATPFLTNDAYCNLINKGSGKMKETHKLQSASVLLDSFGPRNLLFSVPNWAWFTRQDLNYFLCFSFIAMIKLRFMSFSDSRLCPRDGYQLGKLILRWKDPNGRPSIWSIMKLNTSQWQPWTKTACCFSDPCKKSE